MAKYASKVVAQAKAWVGKKESNGSHREIIDIYNAHRPLARGYKVTYTDAWCATFVSAVAIKLGYTSIIPTECGCPKMIELFKGLGQWVENDAHTPKAGDIIFYDWDDSGQGDNRGNPDHVGIVEKVSGSVITVIEGNMYNSVGRRVIHVNERNIRGYGVPKYDQENTALKKTVAEVAQEICKGIGSWGNGEARKKNLAAAGYDYKTVQARVNQLLSKTTTPKVTKGARVKVKNGAKSYEGKKVATFIYAKVYTVDELNGNRAVLDVKGICTAFHVNDLIVQ